MQSEYTNNIFDFVLLVKNPERIVTTNKQNYSRTSNTFWNSSYEQVLYKNKKYNIISVTSPTT